MRVLLAISSCNWPERSFELPTYSSPSRQRPGAVERSDDPKEMPIGDSAVYYEMGHDFQLRWILM